MTLNRKNVTKGIARQTLSYKMLVSEREGLAIIYESVYNSYTVLFEKQKLKRKAYEI